MFSIPAKAAGMFLLAVTIYFAPSATAASPAPLIERVEKEDWKPLVGDRFVVDTQANIGYLIHPNGQFLRLEVATGQNRYVSYIGRYYKATTPTWEWTAQSVETKWDRRTFGPTGTFIRLFKDGDTRTPYGIHTYHNEEWMFDGDRFNSMGCIVIRQEDLNIVLQTFAVNEGSIDVSTQYGLDSSLFVLN